MPAGRRSRRRQDAAGSPRTAALPGQSPNRSQLEMVPDGLQRVDVGASGAIDQKGGDARGARRDEVLGGRIANVERGRRGGDGRRVGRGRGVNLGGGGSFKKKKNVMLG